MTTHETYVHAGRMPVERMAPCGDERLSLTYSGSTYTFRGLSPQQRTTAEHRFAALASEPTANPRAVEVHVCAALPNTFRSFDRRGWEYCLAASHEGGQTWLSGMGFVARIDAAPTRETVLWVDPDLGDDFIDPFENLFRALVCYRVAEAGGLVVHSAGFADREAGIVCFGHSGAGKSTLTGIVDGLGLEILSDELNAIVPTNDGAMVIAMPFAGDFGRARADARAVPLRAIYRLVQAPVARVEPLRTAEQVAYLAGSCPFLNGDPLGAEMVLSNAETLVARVPVKTLAFPKDARAWRAIQSDVGLA